MFYIELKPESNNEDIYEIRLQNKIWATRNVKFLNALIVNDMLIRKVFDHKTSNVQKII
jgi:hypothetical protein